MSQCEDLQPALIDEAFPRPAGLEAHLASCDECRALAAAHRGALRLRGATLTLPRRRPLPEVQRRASIVAALVLTLGGGVGWYQLEFGARAPAAATKQERGFVVSPEFPIALEAGLPASVALEAGLPASVALEAGLPASIPAEEPPGELFALAELQGSISLQLRRDPRDDEAAVRAFGALPRWTAPKRTHPIRSLGRAASPVVFTSEDSP